MRIGASFLAATILVLAFFASAHGAGAQGYAYPDDMYVTVRFQGYDGYDGGYSRYDDHDDDDEGLSDRQILGVLRTIDHAEVEHSSFFMPRLETSRAKGYASRMIRDHTAAMDRIDSLGIGYAESDLSEDLRQKSREAKMDLASHGGYYLDEAYMEHMVKDHENGIRIAENRLLPSAESDKVRREVKSHLSAMREHLSLAREVLEDIRDGKGDGYDKDDGKDDGYHPPKYEPPKYDPPKYDPPKHYPPKDDDGPILRDQDGIHVEKLDGKYKLTCVAGGMEHADVYDWSIHFMPGEIPILSKIDVDDKSIYFHPPKPGLYQIFCAATKGSHTADGLVFLTVEGSKYKDHEPPKYEPPKKEEYKPPKKEHYEPPKKEEYGPPRKHYDDKYDSFCATYYGDGEGDCY